MSLAQEAALDDLAQHLYDFLPGEAASVCGRAYLFEGVARELGLAATSSPPSGICLRQQLTGGVDCSAAGSRPSISHAIVLPIQLPSSARETGKTLSSES
ncbi:MAG TPA: hypothetical protein VIY49_26165 [Bryobacteraceae bacterium]